MTRLIQLVTGGHHAFLCITDSQRTVTTLILVTSEENHRRIPQINTFITRKNFNFPHIFQPDDLIFMVHDVTVFQQQAADVRRVFYLLNGRQTVRH